jgi:hypothetical protein
MDFGAGTSDGAAYRLGRVSENDFNCTRVSQSIGKSHTIRISGIVPCRMS